MDDDPGVRKTLRRLLERMGHMIEESAGGTEAIAWLSARGENAVDLIVTDHSLPGMTGMELVQAVQVQMPGTPVVLISGHLDRALP